MDMFFYYTVTILVLLLSVSFLTVLNLKNSKKNFRKLGFRTISTQLLVLTIWIYLFFQIAIPTNGSVHLLDFLLFITAILFGLIVLKNLKKETELQKKLKKLLLSLKKVNKRLKEIDSQKTEFISLVTHQFRGPIATINGYISLILEDEYGKLENPLKEPIKKIEIAGSTLNNLVDDFLDVSKLEKGEIIYKKEIVNLIEIIDGTLDSFSNMVKRAGLEIKKTYRSAEKILVKVDKKQTEKAICNVIDNAIKYTHRGNIIVSISIDDKYAIVTIKDTGIGIKSKDITHLFKKFVRLENAMVNNVLGIGLGLYMARVVLQAQNGDIWAESRGQGKGSSFYVKLPILDYK